MASERKVIDNFLSLAFSQGLIVLFPLFFYPYLLSKLGVANFGTFIVIQFFLTYSDLVVAFGFSLTATSRIVLANNNTEETCRIITSVYGIKWALCITVLLVALALFFNFNIGNVGALIFVAAAVHVIGNSLVPDWYFQGIQKMRILSILTLASKVVSVILIVLLVRGADDVGYAIEAIAAGNFFAGVVGFWRLFQTVPFTLNWPAKSYLKEFVYESTYVFASIAVAPLYNSSNVLIVKYVTQDPLAVGYYSIVDKVYSSLAMLANINNRAVFPALSQYFASSRTKFLSLVRQVSVLLASGFAILAVSLFVAAPYAVTLFAPSSGVNEHQQLVALFRAMSLSLFMSPFVSFVFQLLIIVDSKKIAVRNLLLAGLLNLLLGVACVQAWGTIGIALSFTVVTATLIAMNTYAYTSKLKFKCKKPITASHCS